MKRLIKTVIHAILAACASGGAAYAVPLSTLLGGQSVTAGDKLFDRWSLVSYTASDPARVFDPGNIDVTPLNDGGIDPGPGLSFAVSGGELSVAGDGVFAFVDLMFGFRVSVLDPAFRIKDNSVAIGAAAITFQQDQNNDDGAFILESIGAAPGLDDLGVKSVEFSILNDALTSNLSDFAVFPPQSEIWVTKNIFVWATDDTDTATLDNFTQRFSQTSVPEPGTLLLVGIGLAGLGARQRARRAEAG